MLPSHSWLLYSADVQIQKDFQKIFRRNKLKAEMGRVINTFVLCLVVMTNFDKLAHSETNMLMNIDAKSEIEGMYRLEN